MRKGFTLIELLVVISIIGILASVVMTSVNSARTKGTDAAIKSSLKNQIAETEIFYDDTGSYAGLCSYSEIVNALSIIEDLNQGGDVLCVDGNDVAGAWAMHAQLVQDNGLYFCVDSEGTSTTTDGSSISVASGSEDATCS